MGRKRTVLAAVLSLAFVAGASGQEWRGGKARVDGVVKNEEGEPLEGCAVKLRWGKSGHGGPDLTADKKGRWAIFGIQGGPWDVDFEAPGYKKKQIQVSLQEGGRNETIEVRLEPEPQTAPAAAAGPQILVGGKKVSKETAEAIEAGNAAMAARNFSAARTSYVQALSELPDNPALLQRVAAAYLGEGNKDEALRYAREASEKAPQETAAWQMIAELEIERGNASAGLEALARVPAEKVVSPGLYLNAGILLYNKKSYPEAESAFDKAIAVKPEATAYYYRGLTRYQEKKTTEARADFQAALDLAPDGPDAKDIREILKSMP